MRNLCVYCGSNPGARPEYVEAARHTGRRLAERGIGIVYGGANRGTMGEIANAALDAGGRVVGVIPHGLVALEVAHTGLSELHRVDTLHQRKALMLELCDGLITLPGGHGTHDEFFEALTWLQLGIHSKPVGLLNVCGYFDGLIAHMDHATREGFIRPEHRAMMLVDYTIDGLLDRFAAWRPPERPPWRLGE